MKRYPQIAWHGYPMTVRGEARGYLQSAYFLREALKNALGNRFVDSLNPKSPAHPKIHFHYCPPHFFRPVPGKVNVLLTMWETETLPDEVRQCARLADISLVPSHYCAAVWKKHRLNCHGVVPLGVPEAFVDTNMTDHSRSTLLLPNQERELLVLWAGSRQKRKGWQTLAPAWKMAFEGIPNRARLYVKTMGEPDNQGVESYNGGKFFIDTRDLDPTQILSTSFGEGFGLTTLEAMATGALAIAPITSGHSEFLTTNNCVVLQADHVAQADYGTGPFMIRAPSVKTIAAALRNVYRMWGTRPLEERRTLGILTARNFTWSHSAEKLLTIIRNLVMREGPKVVPFARSAA